MARSEQQRIERGNDGLDGTEGTCGAGLLEASTGVGSCIFRRLASKT